MANVETIEGAAGDHARWSGSARRARIAPDDHQYLWLGSGVSKAGSDRLEAQLGLIEETVACIDAAG